MGKISFQAGSAPLILPIMSHVVSEEADTLELIRNLASADVRRRGRKYFEESRILSVKRDGPFINAVVEGTETYKIQLNVQRSSFKCSCPAFNPCKHLVALTYELEADTDYSDDEEPEEEEEQLDTASSCRLLIRLNYQGSYFSIAGLDGQKHIRNFQSTADLKLLNSRTRKLLETLVGKGLAVRRLSNYHVDNWLLPLLKDEPEWAAEFVFLLSDGRVGACQGMAPVSLQIDLEEYAQEETVYVIDPVVQFPEQTRVLHGFSLIMRDEEPDIKGGSLHDRRPPVDFWFLKWPDLPPNIKYNLATPLRAMEIQAMRKELNALDVPGRELIPEPFESGPAFCVSLEPEESEELSGKLKIQGKVEIVYAKSLKDLKPGKKEEELPEFAAFPPAPIPKRVFKKQRVFYMRDEEGRVAKRSRLKEKKLLEGGLPMDKVPRSGLFKLGPRKIADFVLDVLPELQERKILVRIHPHLLSLLRETTRAKFKIEQTNRESQDWFEGRIEIRGLGSDAMAAVMDAVKTKEEFIQLPEGDWIRLEDLGVSSLVRSLTKMGLMPRKDGSVPKMNRGEVAALALEEVEALELSDQKNLKSFLNQLDQAPEEFAKRKLLPGFEGKLRSYQATGEAFLYRLYKLNTGGILADDMGLGKTVQALAFMHQVFAENKKKPLFLLVGPVAALSVWKQEAARFTPNLPVTLFHGGDRKDKAIPKSGLMLTTFGVVVKDQELLSGLDFQVLLVDEAQNIKNHNSQAYRVMRTLEIKSKFCLTGTPLENHITEFWALLNLSFPGLPGKRTAFKNQFTESNPDAIQKLKQRIAPFVLRRTKEAVLKELPPRTETSVTVPMTETQQALYEQARREALRDLKDAGPDYLMRMLPHLTRLRRIACHPHLELAEETDPNLSGKFQHLYEILEELMETTSGVLIFSQFTSVLKVAGRMLTEMGYDFHYLDGQTTAKKREKQVLDFQDGKKHFFLISLKAGGTALTLHRADTVLHLDPWWNPAAERQATDRAHRMGQKRPVFVYKFFSEGTVEERVMALQSKKQELFDDLFGESAKGSGAKIDRNELLGLLE